MLFIRNSSSGLRYWNDCTLLIIVNTSIFVDDPIRWIDLLFFDHFNCIFKLLNCVFKSVHLIKLHFGSLKHVFKNVAQLLFDDVTLNVFLFYLIELACLIALLSALFSFWTWKLWYIIGFCFMVCVDEVCLVVLVWVDFGVFCCFAVVVSWFVFLKFFLLFSFEFNVGVAVVLWFCFTVGVVEVCLVVFVWMWWFWRLL